jgi:hemoglobin-like flavoprotein
MNIDLLRTSFDSILEREAAITPRFYEHLFQKYPQARPLFGGNSSRKQQEMLQASLVAVLDHLEDAEWLTTNLRALGERHVGYGVTREMFDWVGDALLTTLAEFSGKDWSPALEREWAGAYGAISEMVLAGMGPASR